MAAEETFLEVIRANSGDDLPKFVYADWLDEKGDARGQLIRLLMEVRERQEEHENWEAFVECVEECFGTGEMDRLIRRMNENQMRLFACQCVESVLPLFESVVANDQRPRSALEVARNYAIGKATEYEMESAWNLVYRAFYDLTCIRESNERVQVAIGVVEALEHIVARGRCHLGVDAAAELRSDAWNTFFVWLVERLLKFRID